MFTIVYHVVSPIYREIWIWQMNCFHVCIDNSEQITEQGEREGGGGITSRLLFPRSYFTERSYLQIAQIKQDKWPFSHLSVLLLFIITLYRSPLTQSGIRSNYSGVEGKKCPIQRNGLIPFSLQPGCKNLR